MTLIKENTVVVSIMLANNETGAIQPIARIGRYIRDFRRKRGTIYPYFHTDASQAPNYLPLNIETLQVDMLTLDGSKIYGPKSVGVLVVRPSVKLRPTVYGGGQERGLRSGTESLALIAGFTKAFEIAQNDREKESERVETLKNYFLSKVQEELPSLIINSGQKTSLPNIISISVPGGWGEYIVLAMDKAGVMVSAGSACSKDSSGSDVIRAMGKNELSDATIRFSLGKYSTKEEIDRAFEIFSKIVSHGKMVLQ
jgi:cysteine desulfurase